MLIDNFSEFRTILGRLKLIVCFASTPSYNFKDLSETRTMVLIRAWLTFLNKNATYIATMLFSGVCAVFLPSRIGFHKSFDAKHTINLKRPYKGNALPRFLLYGKQCKKFHKNDVLL